MLPTTEQMPDAVIIPFRGECVYCGAGGLRNDVHAPWCHEGNPNLPDLSTIPTAEESRSLHPAGRSLSDPLPMVGV